MLLKPTQKKVCFTLEAQEARLGRRRTHPQGQVRDVSGPVKLTLFEDENGLDGNGAYEGCVKKVNKKLVKKIASSPEKFYVNIHTVDYPDGAVRGQLEPTALERG